jgi:flagellar hook assembly protein FlgD
MSGPTASQSAMKPWRAHPTKVSHWIGMSMSWRGQTTTKTAERAPYSLHLQDDENKVSLIFDRMRK